MKFEHVDNPDISKIRFNAAGVNKIKSFEEFQRIETWPQMGLNFKYSKFSFILRSKNQSVRTNRWYHTLISELYFFLKESKIK